MIVKPVKQLPQNLKDLLKDIGENSVLFHLYTRIHHTKWKAFKNLQDAVTGAVMADDTTVDNIVDNYKQYYQLLVKYRTDTLNSTDSAQVAILANKCPYIDGMIIYNARALYSHIFRDCRMWSDIGCDSTISWSERKGHTTSTPTVSVGTQQQYTMMPNPSDGNVTLKQMVIDNAPVDIEVLSATGAMVYKGQLQFATGIAQLKIADVSPGIYLLKVMDKKDGTYNIKFTVIK